jgi:hypothetical protein
MIYLVDPAFDKTQTQKYRVSVLLRPDGYSLCVLDTRTSLFLAMNDEQFLPSNSATLPGNEYLQDHYVSHFRQLELLKFAYGQIDLAFASPKVTLVPPGFSREESVEEYFRFNHPLHTSEKIKSQQVPVGEMTAIYAIPACIEKLSGEWFNSAFAGSSASVFIQSLLKDNAHILARQVFLNVWGSYFDIAVIQGRKLLYYNTFRKQAADDLVYFVIYVLEQMGFVPAEELIFLMGDISAESEEYKLLHQFVYKLHFAGMHDLAEFSPAFSEIQVHRFYTLFNLPFCE